MLQVDATDNVLATQMARGILENEAPIYNTNSGAQKTRREMIGAVIRSQMSFAMAMLNFPKLCNL